MSMDINMNPSANQVPVDGQIPGTVVDQTAAAEALQRIVERTLGGSNVTVTQTSGVDEKDGTRGKTSVPELDEPDMKKANAADLETLIAYFQMEMDEKMAEVQSKRTESLKGQLKSAHDTQMDKINKSIEEAKKQEEAAKAQKAMSWLGAIIAVVVAVVVTVTTGGLAAGFAIAGAALAVGSLVMNETGATKAICKAISNSLRENNPNMTKAEADAAAQGIFAGCELVLSLACGFGGGAAASAAAARTTAQAASSAMKVAQKVIYISTTVVGVAGAATSTASAVIGHSAGMKQADATENQQYLAKIQKMLEQCEDDLQQILDQLVSAGANLLEVMESKTDTNNKILEEIGMQNA